MREYYKPLDALRGLLALAVVFFHAEWASIWTTNPFVENGYLAVDVFFCLSGFLMFRLYGAMSTAKEGRDFLIKRFARLYPLHLFTFVATFLYISLRLIVHKAGVPILDPGEAVPFSIESSDNIYSILSNLTLFHSMGVHSALSFNGPSWSISVEFYTYIVFAALVMFIPLKKPAHFVLVILTGVFICTGLAFVKPNLDITYDLGFFRCLAGFASGIVACWIFINSKIMFNSISVIAASVFELSICVVFIMWFCLAKGLMTFTIAPVMMALVIIFAHGKGKISSLLSLAPFQYLGKISYSVYLNHSLIIIFMGVIITLVFGSYDAMSPMMGEIASVIYIALTLTSSHITYHLVEKPSAKFLRKQLSKPSRRINGKLS